MCGDWQDSSWEEIQEYGGEWLLKSQNLENEVNVMMMMMMMMMMI